MIVRVLLALPGSRARTRLQRLVARRDVIVSSLGEAEDPLARIGREGTDLVVFPRSALPKQADALEERLEKIRGLSGQPEVIVLSEEEDAEENALLLAAGALAVVHGGLSDKALASALAGLLRRWRATAKRRLGADRPEDVTRLDDFASRSPVMQEFMEMVRRVATSESSLLILGETGVGKERLARAIHGEGSRSSKPFVAVNCAALPESLIESELFGHTAGAFTGATQNRRGFFEIADGGTLFLDEIGEMPLHLQAKLLRALQEKRVQPVGSETPVEVDVRVLAATNRDLAQDMQDGRFRPDLFYRLGVVSLTFPSLRDRREDIPDLVKTYVEHFRNWLGRPVTGVRADAMATLTEYEWPGNVRELINVLERAVLLCSGAEITLMDLPPSLLAVPGSELVDGRPKLSYLDGGAQNGETIETLIEQPWNVARQTALVAFERNYLRALLRSTRGRVGEASRRAGLNPRTLYEKMKRLGIRKEEFKRRA